MGWNHQLVVVSNMFHVYPAKIGNMIQFDPIWLTTTSFQTGLTNQLVFFLGGGGWKGLVVFLYGSKNDRCR